MKVLYERGNHYVCNERFGKSESTGFAIYKNGATGAHRVAVIGFSDEKGLQMAKNECDRREKMGEK